ncbi:MMPL family transporter [Cryptosporangium aurantiacum]|uniref:Putative drug exporter of the RND superfamily n=1 Tax=Cryptosporangium aurantiacum TaxID=134849 RepID=A0A1M7MY21_9ACTN|nr:MMPL family transporter [Cryptosporangium aurantiacum]SHM96096.1 putative drug exporter of the RND superfamily [Cryptosporangium aurantiacum]
MNSPPKYAPQQVDDASAGGTDRKSRLRIGKWFVVLFWVVVLIGAGPFAGKVSEVEDNSVTSFLPREAQSTRVAELLPRFQQDDLLPAVVVYARDGGLTAADRTAITADRSALEALGTGGIEGPIPSDDGAALMYVVPVSNNDDPLGAVERMRDRVADSAPDGVDVHVAGAAGNLYDSVSVFDDLDANLLLATVGVVTLLLLLTYRSPVLWILPLLAVGFGSQLATAVVYLLAKHADLPVNGQSGGILTVLVFGAGTDYALLLISRYREELRRHADRHAAMATALRRTAPAVLASAGTVVVGLLCLLAADQNSTRSLGATGAVGVACAAIVILTLLPALLVIVGRWAFWPLVPRVGSEPVRGRLLSWDTVAAAVGRRPRLLWMSAAVFLVALTLGLTTMTLGASDAEQYKTPPDSVRGQELVAKHYPAGATEPTQIVAAAGSADAVVAAARSTDGVARVDAVVRGGELVLVPVVLTDAPDSDAAEKTVQRLRSALAELPEADAAVGGRTASTLDTRETAARDRWVVIPLALVAIALILIAVLRSLVAPLLLIVTNVLSFLAALGGTALILKSVFDVSAVDYSLPLLGFLFLVSLGVDYNVFLMTRVREEVASRGHREGVLVGLSTTGGVITSAGLVLAGTFAVFLGMPLVGMLAMGLLVAVGVLLDTLLVRTLLVPALALDVGRATWWPKQP